MQTTNAAETLTERQDAWLAANGWTATVVCHGGLMFRKAGGALTDGEGGTVPAAWTIWQERRDQGFWHVALSGVDAPISYRTGWRPRDLKMAFSMLRTTYGV